MQSSISIGDRCDSSHLWLNIAAVFVALSAAAGESERPVEGIMDNSFFVEEAYNQEPNVVQHIFNGVYEWEGRSGGDDHLWLLAFTQEWPVFSQRHQFSYTIPYTFERTTGDSIDGLGDIFLNYRFQAYFREDTLTAFAPRASLVLPTGDPDRGLGDDTVGAQFNLPFSTALGDRWFVHFNAGLTWLPEASSSNGRDLTHYTLGASTIYALNRDLHFLIEWVGYWEDMAGTGSPRHHEFGAIISPGVRKALNFDNGSQLVLGAAIPIGLNSFAPDLGVFLYLSFEHFFGRRR